MEGEREFQSYLVNALDRFLKKNSKDGTNTSAEAILEGLALVIEFTLYIATTLKECAEEQADQS